MSLKSKPLADLPEGFRVLIDANIFIYHFAGASAECTQFLLGCEQGRFQGVTGIHVVLEVLHRLMIAEAIAQKLAPSRNAVKKLKENPDVIKRLKSYQEKTRSIREMGIEILPLSAEILEASAACRKEYGLLINDSVTVALALRERVQALASADRDFERVNELVVYRPMDVAMQISRSEG